MFEDCAGSMCGALPPTGNALDAIAGVDCTLIDNGKPCAVMQAADFGLRGEETRDVLDADAELMARLEDIRRVARPMTGLGDVADKSVPKMTRVSAPRAGGALATRSFSPHRCHASIGVFAAISVATACTLAPAPAAALAQLPEDGHFRIEHPGGSAEVLLELDAQGEISRAGTIRTTRKLCDLQETPGFVQVDRDRAPA